VKGITPVATLRGGLDRGREGESAMRYSAR
jgi:hypothetical protein